MAKIGLKLLALTAFLALSAAAASAQDFSHAYSLSPGGIIMLNNVSGDISVTSYNGNQVIVTAVKKGADRDLISVEDESSGNTVSLKAKYPRSCNCQASIDFTIQVPAGIQLTLGPINSASGDISVTGFTGQAKLNTASGDLKLINLSGDIQANTASGDVHVEGVSGAIKANTASGDVNAVINSLEAAGDMRFNSSSGNVTVTVPGELDATVDISTSSGSLHTDFPLQMADTEGGREVKSAHGMLGRGTHVLKISSASGDVTLKRN